MKRLMTVLATFLALVLLVTVSQRLATASQKPTKSNASAKKPPLAKHSGAPKAGKIIWGGGPWVLDDGSPRFGDRADSDWIVVNGPNVDVNVEYNVGTLGHMFASDPTIIIGSVDAIPCQMQIRAYTNGYVHDGFRLVIPCTLKAQTYYFHYSATGNKYPGT